jgi:hypothetical protein
VPEVLIQIDDSKLGWIPCRRRRNPTLTPNTFVISAISGIFRRGPDRLLIAGRLSTNPVVCRRAMPKRTFIVGHVWIAFVGKTVPRTVFLPSIPLYRGWRPRLPVGGGTHAMSGSNQIVREPRCFSASF